MRPSHETVGYDSNLVRTLPVPETSSRITIEDAIAEAVYPTSAINRSRQVNVPAIMNSELSARMIADRLNVGLTRDQSVGVLERAAARAEPRTRPSAWVSRPK